MKCSITVVVLGLAGLTLAGCASQASLASQNPGTVKPSVVVYYMHGTARCTSCLSIEKEVRKALDDAFASELASGQVEFRSEDYWVNENLANRYGVDRASVVVVVVADGQEVSHENLDRVWELKSKPAELRSYVDQAVRTALAKATG